MNDMAPKRRKDEDGSSEQDAKKAKSDDAESENDQSDPKQLAEENLQDERERQTSQSGPCGPLLICGGTNWDLIGRKEAPKNSGGSGGPNLWEPHTISSLKGMRIRHVASGPSACHSIIVTENGTAMSFGRNDKGQCGHNNTDKCDKPKVIESLKNHTVVQASCGKNHTLVLTDKGLVFGFGENKMAQLGQGHQKPMIAKPVQIVHPENRKIKKVACGSEFSMFADESHMLYSFGSPEHGQLGHNTDGQYFVSANKLGYDCEVLPRHVAVFVEKNKDGFVNVLTDVRIVDVSCGNSHTIARDDKDRVFTWGFGGYGRLGHQQPKDEHVPRLLTYFNHRGASAIFAGATYTMALSMTQLFFWGQTKSAGEATMYPKPVQDLSGWEVRSVGCSKTSIVVAADDSVVSWGPSPTFGELGYGLKKGGQKSSTNPKIVNPLEGVYVHAVTCGYGHTLLIARDDQDGDKEKIAQLPVFDPASS